MNDKLIEKVNFQIIRYANCWEDADILLEGLSPIKGSKILSIGSAGDNSFSLLVANPEMVIAVDINKIQLYLIELKKICIKRLVHEEALNFLGFKPSSNRTNVFNKLKNELSNEAKKYWEANINCIESGIIYAGKFERYFILFSHKILPCIHSNKTVQELFKIKPEKEQEVFYNKKWNTWRWKTLFKIFFSRYIMGKFGRDPAFLKEVEISVGDNIYNKAGRHLQSAEAQHNFILHFNLTRNFGNLYPHYMRKENYDIIQSNINNLQLHEGYAEDAITSFGKFNYMNLSNIFEYMNEHVFETTSHALINGMTKEGKLAYWNLMVRRRISAILPGKVNYEEDVSIKLTEKDKGFFYNQFIIDSLK